MSIYLVTVGLVFVIMLAGIVVDHLYHRFAARNPQLGPFRDSGKCGSCSSGSGCADTSRAADAAWPVAPR